MTGTRGRHTPTREQRHKEKRRLHPQTTPKEITPATELLGRNGGPPVCDPCTVCATLGCARADLDARCARRTLETRHLGIQVDYTAYAPPPQKDIPVCFTSRCIKISVATHLPRNRQLCFIFLVVAGSFPLLFLPPSPCKGLATHTDIAPARCSCSPCTCATRRGNIGGQEEQEILVEKEEIHQNSLAVGRATTRKRVQETHLFFFRLVPPSIAADRASPPPPKNVFLFFLGVREERQSVLCVRNSVPLSWLLICLAVALPYCCGPTATVFTSHLSVRRLRGRTWDSAYSSWTDGGIQLFLSVMQPGISPSFLTSTSPIF